MRKSANSEGENKISVSKIKRNLSIRYICANDIVFTPMRNLQSLEGKIHKFSGMAVGVICNGTAKVTIDGRHFEMRRNSLVLLRDSSTVSDFKCSKACMGYFITYPTSYLNAVKISTSDLLTINLMFGKSPCLQVSDDDMMRLHSISTTLNLTDSANNSQYDKQVKTALFDAFFYSLASIICKYTNAELDEREQLSRSDDLMYRFTTLINSECDRERSVEYYASQLGITPKYLSLVCRNKTGVNASKIIDAAVIHKAKALLQQQDLSILDVSQRLNFVSQSFFGKYFKQRTGISPSRYKSQH